MMRATQSNRAKNWVVKGLKIHYTFKLATGLALGALLLTMFVGFPSGDTHGEIADIGASYEQPSVEDRLDESREFPQTLVEVHQSKKVISLEERYPFGVLSEEQMPEGILPVNDPLARLNVWSAR